MQYEYTMPQNIFEENGEVMCAGWAKKPYFNFNKELSKQNKHIKESVSYFLSTGEVSLYISTENSGLDFYIKIALANLKNGNVISDFAYKNNFSAEQNFPKAKKADSLFFQTSALNLP